MSTWTSSAHPEDPSSPGGSAGPRFQPQTQPQSHPTECTVRIRPHVQALPRYIPGQTKPGAIKLSSNENPYPPADSIIDEVSSAAALVNRYPDLMAAPVKTALSAHLGIPDTQICIGAGSSAVLLAALMTVGTPGAEVIFPWRSFESYPIAVPAAGATPIPVPLTDTWEHDLPAMHAAITADTSAIILCSPNNPTGTALPLSRIDDFLNSVPPHILVLVDEAYIEFSTRTEVRSALPLIERHPNLLVLRTFSKAYGLAGMRVGYGMGHQDLIAAIQAVSIPFGVSGPAQSAAVAVLSEQDQIAASVQSITNERARMREALRAMGWNVPESQANFLWLPDAPRALFQYCQEGGILVRPFPEGIRLTVGTPEENTSALSLIEQFTNIPASTGSSNAS